MNEFDQFVKHDLRVKHYARYTDDFIVIADKPSYLENLLPSMADFLSSRLALSLHPGKISIQSSNRGVDFLGYVIFPHHRLMRSRTRKRMLKKIKRRVEEYQRGLITEYSFSQSLHSYLGALSHANTYKLGRDMRNKFWL